MREQLAARHAMVRPAIEDGEVVTDPKTWGGFQQLPARVQTNLAKRMGVTEAAPTGTPNIQANNPAGDLANEVQEQASISAWGRFVVAAWSDSKGFDAPLQNPPSTWIGFAWSCDFGATWTDGGSIPRPVANEQDYLPWVTHNSAGHFYLVGAYDTNLDVNGVPTESGVGLWAATLDSVACTLTWGARQTVTPLSSTAGAGYESPRVAIDPSSGRLWVVTTYEPPSGDWQIVATASSDGGATWTAAHVLSHGSFVSPPSYFPLRADIAIGPNGEAYVVWADSAYWYWCDMSSYYPDPSGIQFAKSTDGGLTWSNAVKLADAYSTYQSFGPMFGLYFQKYPRIAIDQSTAATRGNAYVTWNSSGYWPAPGNGTGVTIIETEPNGAPNVAQTVSLGDNVSGVGANNNDVDLYRIDLTAGDVLLARAEPPGFCIGTVTNSFRLALYTQPLDLTTSPLDTVLVASGGFYFDLSEIVFTCKTTGTYYLRVLLRQAGPNIAYTLKTRRITFQSTAGSGRDESDIVLSRSTNGGTSWSTPKIVNSDIGPGYHESMPALNVDASGRVRVVWHDHRETEATPRQTLEGQLTDLYMGESTDGGVSFAAGIRISDVSSIFGRNTRVLFVNYPYISSLVNDDDHLFFAWDDQRTPTRLTTAVNVVTQFLDREAPRIAFTSAPAEGGYLTSLPFAAIWTGNDRREGTTGNEYRVVIDKAGSGQTYAGTFGGASSIQLSTSNLNLGDGAYTLSVYGRDLGGNAAVFPTQRHFTLDQNPPSIAMLTGPTDGSRVATPTVTFTWSVSDAISPTASLTTTWEIDGVKQVAPAIGQPLTTASFGSLSNDSHTFAVWATDPAGNESRGPLIAFTLDTSAPETQIDSGPADASVLLIPSPTFGFSGTDNLTPANQLLFAWRQDGGTYSAFMPTATGMPIYSTDGNHTFEVKAIDLTGNEDLTPAIRSFTVHAQAPVVTITAGPGPGAYSGASVTFNWSSTQSPVATSVTYATSIDAGTYSATSSSTTLTLGGLAPGTHALTIRATDDAGLQGTMSRSWSVDAIRPIVSFTIAPATYINTTSADVAWTGSDTESGGVEFSSRLDVGPWSPYSPTTTATVTGLSPGPHLFELQARDAAGNVSGGSCLIDPSGLVSWWHADGNANDAVGTNPGAEMNGIGYAAGNRGLAFSLDGTNDHILVPDNASLDPGIGSFTLEAWVNVSPGSAIQRNIAVKSDAGGSVTPSTPSEYRLYRLSGNVFFGVHDQSSGVPTQFYSTGAVLSPGIWHYVVAGRDMSSGEIFIYVDGVRSGGGPLGAAMSGFIGDSDGEPDPLIIGARRVSGTTLTGFSNGQIDDVVYSSRALSAGEVAAIYATGGRDMCVPGTPASAAFTVDPTPPDTQILTGPADGSTGVPASPTFTFTGTDDQATPAELVFAWRQDGGTYSGFTPTMTATPIYSTDGSHTFEVKALDLAGNEDPTPAIRTFTVTQEPPIVTITTGPAPGGYSGASVTFTWSSTHSPATTSVTYATSLDGGAYSTESSSTTLALSGLSEASHTLIIRATDDAAQQGSVSRTWLVDATPPLVSITSPPAAYINTTSVDVAWTGSDTGSGGVEFSSRLDAGTWSAFSPTMTATLTSLPSGAHLFEVQARDAVGNLSGTPASAAFAVDLTAPDTQILAGPPQGGTSATSVNFTFSATDDQTPPSQLLFSWRQDGGTYTAFSPTATAALSGLSFGTHTFEVKSRDLAGNEDATPDVRSWTASNGLAGTYTIGPAGNYSTLSAAAADLVAKGVVGPVSFLIQSGTYTGTTSLPAITGASATNRIRFVSLTGNAADVTLQAPAVNSAGTDAAVRLDGGSFFDFDSLTITTSGGLSSAGALVWFSNSPGNIRFQGSVFNTVGINRSALRSGSFVDANGLEIRNCQFTLPLSSSYGLNFNGGFINGGVIQGNTFTFGSSGSHGISSVSSTGLLVQGNTFNLSGGDALILSSAASPVIRGNHINGAGTGLSITVITAGGLIANNFIQASSAPILLSSPSAGGVTIAFNSLNATGAVSAVSISGAATGSVTLMNNVLACSGGSAPISTGTGAAAIFTATDYNDLYTTGPTLATIGNTNYSTLAALRSATGFETHGITANPAYGSTTDLHTSAPALDGAGTPMAAVLDDIDGETRNATTPDIGADEFTTSLVPMAGSYTIGASGTHATIAAAAADLVARGISAPVSFLIQSGSYTGSTYLPPIAGASATNRIRFVSQSGNAADVTLRAPATSNTGADAVIRLDGARFVDFDSLTVTTSGGTANTAALVWLSHAPINDRFQGCSFSTVGANRSAIRGTNGTNADGLEIRNCQIAVQQSSSWALSLTNGSWTGGVFQGNAITVATVSNGISLQFSAASAGIVIEGNTFAMSSGIAIELSTASGPVIRGNRISGAQTGLQLTAITSAGLVANNFVQVSGVTLFIIGGDPGAITVAHNSLNSTGPGTTVAVNISGAQTGAVTLMNNVVACTGGAVPLSTDSDAAIAASDYNDFYTTGPTLATYASINYGTLAALRAATGFETHSISANPAFVSTTDLHSGAVALNAAGTPLAAVLDDIDGEARDATTPDIGADEFSTALTPLAGIYTVGPSGDYATPLAVVADLTVRGVSGPASFLIQNGTYTGSLYLPPITGASATNRVRFVSQSGTASDVTLQAPAFSGTGTDAVIRLDGGRYVDFDSMTVTCPGGTASSSGLVWLSNAPTGDRFQGCTFKTVGASRSAIRGASNAIVDGLEVRNCDMVVPLSSSFAVTLSGGSCIGGVFQGNTFTCGVSGSSALNLGITSVSAGIVIEGNTFNMPGNGTAILLMNGSGPVIRGNRISGAGTGLNLTAISSAGLVANNFIDSQGPIKIFNVGGLALTLAYNSLNATDGSAVSITAGGPGSVTLKNNVMSCTGGSVPLSTASGAVAVASDYNDLYTTGPTLATYANINYGTLAALRAATGLETHSISANPAFVSTTDLHTSSVALNAAGTPLAAVLDDIDGEARDATTPDIGADEFSTALTPLAGIYTVGASGDYATLAEAVAALVVRGVSGPASFLIQNGTYTGSLYLPPITGASATSRIRFVSQSGNPADVVIRAPGNDAFGIDAVLRLDSGRYFDFDSLTILSSTGGSSSNGALVWLSNAPLNDRFQGSVLNPGGANRSAIRGSSGAVPDGLEVRNCQFTMSFAFEYALHLTNGSMNSATFQGNTVTGGTSSSHGLSITAAANGMVIQGNTFNLTGGTAAWLENLSGPVIRANRISGAGTGLVFVSISPGGLLANNFIQASGNPLQLMTLASPGGNFLVLYNSLNPTGTLDAIVATGGSGGSVVLKNNILACPGGGRPVNASAGTALFFASDYNDFYTTGATIATYSGTSYSTLAALRAGTGFETHGVSANPVFVSTTDLHASAPSLDGAATPIAAVLDDIDGQIRNATTPDIGADEFSTIVDNTPPNTSFTAGIADNGYTNLTSATFNWIGADDISLVAQLRYSFKLDGGADSAPALATSNTFNSLTEGVHTVSVYAIDEAGNADPTPAGRTFTVDLTGPDTQVLSGPVDGSTGTTASPTFTFTGTDNFSAPAALQFAWRMDGGTYSSFSGTTSATPSGLPDASHTFQVKTLDQAGNQDASPAQRTWTVHVQVPVVTFTGGPSPGGFSGANVTFDWSSTRSPVATGLTYATSLDGGTYSVESPTATATLVGLAEGGHSFAVRATDDVGLTGIALAVWTVDVTAPNTIVATGPADNAWHGSNNPSWTLSATDNFTSPGNMRFKWRNDGGVYTTPGSNNAPAFLGLTEGDHTFDFVALDQAGNEDPSPASRLLHIDVTPPSVQIFNGPIEASTVTSTAVTFDVTGSDNLTPTGSLQFAYSRDGGGFGTFATSTSLVVGGLTEGSHLIAIRSRDLAGNQSASVTRGFTVHVGAPQVVIVYGPPTFTNQTSVTFRVSANSSQPPDAILYAFRLDLASYSAFDTVKTFAFSGLSEGAHALDVQAKDSYNLQGSLSIPFTVDLTPPSVVISSGPPNAGWSNTASPTFGFTGTDNLAPSNLLKYSYSLDAGAYTPYSSQASASFSGLSEGGHAITVIARDACENQSPVAAARTWTIDLTPPETQIIAGPTQTAIIDGSSVTFSFSGSDDATPAAQLRFATRLLTGSFSNPTAASSVTITALPDGPHTFEVRTVDLAGNVDPSPDARSFTTDALPPVIAFQPSPSEGQCLQGTSVGLGWSATDVVTPQGSIEFAYALDAAPYTPFAPTATASFSGLAEGVHVFAVQARDDFGHTATATRAFRIDNTAPVALAPTTRLLDGSTVRVNCTGHDDAGLISFRLQISSDPAFGSILLDTSIPASGQYDYVGTLGSTYYARASATDCAGNVGALSGTSNGSTLANLPDLVVTQVSVPATVTSGQPLQVAFTVNNSGLGATSVPQWFDDVVLSPTAAYDPGTAVFLARATNQTFLATGESYTATASGTVPIGLSGTWYAIALADNGGQVPETNGGNNVKNSTSIAVALGSHADLRVTQVVAPPTALSGEVVNVQWTVANQGSGRTNVDGWWDTVFLSSDGNFDYQLVGATGLRVLDQPLGVFWHAGALEAGQTYARSASITLPEGISGIRYVMLASDMRADFAGQVVAQRGDVFENLSELNVGVADSSEITLQLPSDLVAESVSGPTSGSSGGSLLLSFTVRNSGFNPTPNTTWTDRVWLSADATLTGSDLLLGSFSHGGSLALGSSYTSKPTVGLPNGLSGTYYLFMTTDVYGQIGEYREDNNEVISASTLQVNLTPSPNLVPAGGTTPALVAAGDNALVTWNGTNLGPASLSAGWHDDLVLSQSPTWPGGGYRAISIEISQSLPPGQSYAASGTFRVPTSFSGRWYAYVIVDSRNEIYEHTQEGDNLQAVGSFDVTPYPPVDLAVSAVSIPATGAAAQPLSASFTVTNIGQATTLGSSWGEEVWLSTDQVLQTNQDFLLSAPGHGGALGPGASYSRTLGATLPNGFTGTFYAIVRSDPGGGGSGDGNLANNIAVSPTTVAITAAPPADIVVNSVTGPAGVDAGQPVHLDWTLRNQGTGDILNRTWFVNFYLSLDPLLDGSDVYLGNAAGPTTLLAGGNAPQGVDLAVPGWASGAYYLIALADSRNDIWEGVNEGNNAHQTPVLVNLPAPSDLVVSDVVVPPSAVPGEAVTVSFTLQNTGSNPAVGTLQNAVYASVDDQFVSANDPLVGIQNTAINLPPGATQQVQQQVAMTVPLATDALGNVIGVLPPLSPGFYRGIVHVNIRASIREMNLTNNEAVSSPSLQAQVEALTLDLAKHTSLTSTLTRFYQVTVPAGQDLQLTLASDVPDATNEMFVAFNRTPTLTDFDLSGPATFTSHPSVLVPGTAAGTYYIMLVARNLGSVASLENVDLLAKLLPFQISSIAPAAGGQGTVTVHVHGAGMRNNTEVRLEQSGIPAATGMLRKFVNTSELVVRFDLASVPLGLYDVVAQTGPDVVLLPASFAVETALPVAVETRSRNADVLRRTAVGIFELTFHNSSNLDIPIMKARVLFPATSTLRTLETTPGLLRRSDRSGGLLAPLSGDVMVLNKTGGPDSIAAVDLVASNLSPGEERVATLGIAGFQTSPFSVRALTEVQTLNDFLDGEVALNEAARLRLLGSPAGIPGDLLQVAGSPFEFSDQMLTRTVSDPGLLDALEVLQYISQRPGGAVVPSPTLQGPDGPQVLLEDLAAGNCVIPSGVAECQPDVAPASTALPACVVIFPTDQPVLLPIGGGAFTSVFTTTSKGYSSTLSANAKVVTPCDPNVLTGPAGYGDQRWVSPSDVLAYRVDYENLSGVASAPAQVVKITLPLDPILDPTSFRLGSFGFGTHTITVPPDRTSYSAQPFFSDLGLDVRVTAGIDLATRQANWTFTSIDPATGLQPTNPYIGFLPVNDPTGRGTGFTNLTIKALSNAAPGATIAAQASIKFDANAPLPTSQVSNRVDSRLPASSVSPTVQVLDDTRVRVAWNSSDDTTGAGLRGIALYRKQDSGTFQLYQDALTGQSVDVAVQAGHSYSFFSIATDNTGNTEPAKTQAEASITVGTVVLPVKEPTSLPRVTALMQNFPNPFHGSTRIRFDLARDEVTTLELFDVQGRLVHRPLDHKRLPAGQHFQQLDRLPLNAGIYFYRLRAGAFVATRRMVILR